MRLPSTLFPLPHFTTPSPPRAVEGTSDDLDKPIAALFRDGNFKQRHRLGSLNSVNVARVLMQAVHYFYAYFRTVDEAQTVGREA